MLGGRSIAHDNGYRAMILIALYPKTPEHVVTFGWVVNGLVPFSVVAAATRASLFTATVIIRDQIVFAVDRVLASTDPCDGRWLGPRRAGAHAASATGA